MKGHMKKLLTLVDYSFKTGDSTFKDYSLVLTEVPLDASDEDVRNEAIRLFKISFAEGFQESELIYVVAKPTISKDHSTKVIGHIVHRMTEIPPIERKDEQLSKTVLIDLDGRKRNFTLGSYDTLNKHWITQSGDDVDMKHGVWKDVI